MRDRLRRFAPLCANRFSHAEQSNHSRSAVHPSRSRGRIRAIRDRRGIHHATLWRPPRAEDWILRERGSAARGPHRHVSRPASIRAAIAPTPTCKLWRTCAPARFVRPQPGSAAIWAASSRASSLLDFHHRDPRMLTSPAPRERLALQISIEESAAVVDYRGTDISG